MQDPTMTDLTLTDQVAVVDIDGTDFDGPCNRDGNWWTWQWLPNPWLKQAFGDAWPCATSVGVQLMMSAPGCSPTVFNWTPTRRRSSGVLLLVDSISYHGLRSGLELMPLLRRRLCVTLAYLLILTSACSLTSNGLLMVVLPCNVNCAVSDDQSQRHHHHHHLRLLKVDIRNLITWIGK